MNNAISETEILCQELINPFNGFCWKPKIHSERRIYLRAKVGHSPIFLYMGNLVVQAVENGEEVVFSISDLIENWERVMPSGALLG